jgi:glycerophosphoryl diester phosphodiesterase
MKSMIRVSDCTLIRTILLLSAVLPLQLYSQQGIPDCHISAPRNGTYVIAHRGAHIGIPENSLAAYQKAIDLGCDYVEIDVRTTKDGKFVSIHNSKVDEYVTGVKGKVSELNLVELRSLDIGLNTGPEWKGTKIPTFEEILDLCKGKTGIYLDLKAAEVSRLVEVIKKYNMEKDIIWYISASDTKDIDELKKSCPDCILMPDPGSQENIKTVVSKFNPCILATDVDKLGEKFVNTAHQCNTLVISDEKEGTETEWRQMLDWKTDGIQTDNPEKLISFLKSRKH